jgi:hypothetical protein
MSAAEQKVVIFLHVPKASGTTLSTIVERQYTPAAVRRTDPDHRAFRARLQAQSDAEKADIQCVLGHMVFGLHRYLPRPAVYITMLRDPVDRLISHYAYVLRTPEHYLHREVVSRRLTLAEYADSGLTSELNDGQVRLLSGWDDAEEIPCGRVPRAMLEAAKENLRRHFAAFGVTERFDATLLLFRQRLGWRHVYHVPHNVGRGRPRRADVPPEAIRSIESHNALDRELYRWARTALDETLAREVPALRVRAFRAANRAQALWGAWRARLGVAAAWSWCVTG